MKKGLIIGAAIAGFGIAILNANQAERSDKIEAALVETNAVLPENEGKIVLVSGTPFLENDGLLADGECGFQVTNALLYRRVPYQKVYAVHEERVKKVVSGDEYYETRKYVVKDWILANRERDPVVSVSWIGTKYENPPAVNLKPFVTKNPLHLGEFTISAHKNIAKFITTETRGFPPEELEKNCGEYIKNSGLDLKVTKNKDGFGMLSNGSDIGDVCVNFSYETLEGAEPITVVGKQIGNTVVFDEEQGLSDEEHILEGTMSKEEFITSIRSEDRTSRKIGYGMIAAGLLMVAAVFIPKVLRRAQ